MYNVACSKLMMRNATELLCNNNDTFLTRPVFNPRFEKLHTNTCYPDDSDLSSLNILQIDGFFFASMLIGLNRMFPKASFNNWFNWESNSTCATSLPGATKEDDTNEDIKMDGEKEHCNLQRRNTLTPI